MLLAINVGNTHISAAIWDCHAWIASKQGPTHGSLNWCEEFLDQVGAIDRVIMASVVPTAEHPLMELCERILGRTPDVLRKASDVGLPVEYEPADGVGADRLANCLGALAKYAPPLIVVDFGTATTIEVVDARGVFIGGAIMAGAGLALGALQSGTALLPTVELIAPEVAIGKSTIGAIQSGATFGHAGAVDALVRRMGAELGSPATVIATGGLGELFSGVCESVQFLEPTLTLDGLVRASELLRP